MRDLRRNGQFLRALHDAVLQLPSIDKTASYLASNLYNSCENFYYDTRAEFLEHIEQFAIQECREQREADRQAAAMVREQQSEIMNSTMRAPVSNSSSLEKVKLSDFHGSPEKREHFRDMFHSCVHNIEEMPVVLKYQHLRSHLSGEALNKIKHLNMSEAHYIKAWEAIHKRYENHGRIVSYH